jgi:hypothetical protein
MVTEGSAPPGAISGAMLDTGLLVTGGSLVTSGGRGLPRSADPGSDPIAESELRGGAGGWGAEPDGGRATSRERGASPEPSRPALRFPRFESRLRADLAPNAGVRLEIL